MADIRLNRILCAVTFAPQARRVIDWAARLAALSDAEVRLFHALDRARATPGPPPWNDAPDDCAQALNRLFAIARAIPRRTRLSAAVTEGDAASEILRHAGLVRPDLIALGMDAGGGTTSPLVARLASDGHCPILAVREGNARAVDSDRAIGDVLCAFDSFHASAAAADYALALGRRTGAHVTVIQVRSSPDRPQGIDGNVFARGLAYDDLAQLAHRRASDLIVVGIDRERANDAAARVMRCAPCSVLLVPPRSFPLPRTRRPDRPEHPDAV